jgi:peptidoglycan/LPS O-acetylase OafA/YrhL
MTQFVWGLITMGYLIAGLFFLRFWSRTRDRLFGAFAIAFWLLAANQGLVAVSGVPREEQTWFYLLRLVAFLAIIAAVIEKNTGRRAR